MSLCLLPFPPNLVDFLENLLGTFCHQVPRHPVSPLFGFLMTFHEDLSGVKRHLSLAVYRGDARSEMENSVFAETGLMEQRGCECGCFRIGIERSVQRRGGVTSRRDLLDRAIHTDRHGTTALELSEQPTFRRRRPFRLPIPGALQDLFHTVISRSYFQCESSLTDGVEDFGGFQGAGDAFIPSESVQSGCGEDESGVRSGRVVELL